MPISVSSNAAATELHNYKTRQALAAFRRARKSAAGGSGVPDRPKQSRGQIPKAEATTAGPFYGLAIPYNTWTGDGRYITKGTLTWGSEPIPLIFDPQDSDHDGFTVGHIDSIQHDDAGVQVSGWFVDFTDAADQARVQQAKDLISRNAIGWSAALDDTEAEVTLAAEARDRYRENDDGSITIRVSSRDMSRVYTNGRVRHLALVDTPAFPGARPRLGLAPVTASGIAPLPKANFAVWESDKPIPLQVTPEGRVFGHAAGDGIYRNGTGTGPRYSRDPDRDMRNFHTGTAVLDNGEVIRVGALTCSGMHAAARGPVEDQRRHHEDSTTVWAKVRAWNDKQGRLCVAGSVMTDLPAAELQQTAGLPLSPELWPVPGVAGLTLVGLHSVVSPAWPVA